ncbi:MAG: CoA-binding protein [Holophagaceae bacterium]|nr:CoA-binding protein [Holophagaceae bacterium]
MTGNLDDRIKSFMASGPYAVVGASPDRGKYGNKVLRAYQQRGMEVYPINPRALEIEGLKAYATLADVPVKLRALSVITPPAITEQVVEAAAAAGIRMVWMQPGAESYEAIRKAEELGMEVIAGGPCFLVLAHYREF